MRLHRALKDPFAVMNCHWYYNARPSAAMRQLRDNIRAWQETQKDLPEHQQEKLVIYTCWTSLLDNLQLFLAHCGIFTATLTDPNSSKEARRSPPFSKTRRTPARRSGAHFLSESSRTTLRSPVASCSSRMWVRPVLRCTAPTGLSFSLRGPPGRVSSYWLGHLPTELQHYNSSKIEKLWSVMGVFGASGTWSLRASARVGGLRRLGLSMRVLRY